MELAKYEAMIGQMEAVADQSHRRFRWKVVGLVVLGYALAFFILLGIVVLSVILLLARAFGFAVRLIRVGWHFMIGSCRGFWIKADDSIAVDLPADLMAPLTLMVESVAKDLKAPPVHRVLISSDWNATAYQRPSFGPFGPFKNEVTIGLPLLAVLTAEDVRAVVGHEIGHIHRGHSRFALRVAQISGAWDRAINELAKGRVSAGSIYKLFNWYAPRLRAAQHVLARMAEREANRAQTEIGGVRGHVQSRVDLAVYRHTWSERFNDLLKASFVDEDVPPQILADLCVSLRQPVDRELMIEQLQERLSQKYDPFSTHPPLGQIFREMGVDPTLENVLSMAELPGPERPSAGETLFAGGWTAFTLAASREWAKKHREFWLNRRKIHLAKREKLEALLAKADEAPPTEAERVELGVRLLNDEEYDTAMLWIEPVKNLNARAQFAYGLLLRRQKNPEWVQWLEEAAKDFGQRKNASQWLINHYTALGARDQVQRLHAGLEELNKREATQRQKMLQLSTDWQYVACPWTPEQVATVFDELMKIRFIKRAYLLGRTDGDSAHDNCCLVVQFGHGATPKKIMERLVAYKYPGRCFVFTLAKVPDAIASNPAARVFDRKSHKAHGRRLAA